MFAIKKLLFSVIIPIMAVYAQEIPSSPCPEIFQYDTKANGNIYGRINIPYDGTNNLQLGVNASMKGYHTDNLRVRMVVKMNTAAQDIVQKKTTVLSYDLYFPFQNSIPKITRIIYNQKVYCTGPPEEHQPGSSGITNLWTGHNYYFHSPINSLKSSSSPSSVTKIPNLPKPAPEYLPSSSVIENPQHQSEWNIPIINHNNAEINYSPHECGISKKLFVIPLIVGGAEITDGMFPWLTALFTISNNGYNYKCTANLLSKNHVITAARCVSFFKLQIVPTEDILLIFGKTNLRNWATNGAITRGASRVKTHPEFDPNSGHGDLAVITLDKELIFSATISPICLWTNGDNNLENIVNVKGTVVGWGADEEAQQSGIYSRSVAKSLDIPIVSQEKCLYLNLTYYQLTSDITFCAGQKNGKGTCIGDSGAGFMIQRNGKFYLRGLASLILTENDKCALSNYMVFSDAAKVNNWIRNSMK